MGSLDRRSNVEAARVAGLRREAQRRRDLARDAVEVAYSKVLFEATRLGIGLIERANVELARDVPDVKILDLGLKASDRVVDRVVGKVASKVEGEVRHEHVFAVLRDAVRDVVDAEVVEEG